MSSRTAVQPLSSVGTGKEVGEMDRAILTFCYRYLIGVFAKLARRAGLFASQGKRNSTWVKVR